MTEAACREFPEKDEFTVQNCKIHTRKYPGQRESTRITNSMFRLPRTSEIRTVRKKLIIYPFI